MKTKPETIFRLYDNDDGSFFELAPDADLGPPVYTLRAFDSTGAEEVRITLHRDELEWLAHTADQWLI